jgi:hypothetical protein
VKNVQIDTGNIFGANWSLSQTISTGLLGLGNREASLALTDLVIITFFPFIDETSLSLDNAVAGDHVELEVFQ